MEKFIINHSLPDFETVTIEDTRLCSKDSLVVLVLDDSTSTTLHVYYNRVIDIILSGAKLITISVGKESKIRKSIMMVMALYRDYNIYVVDSKATITSEYIKILDSRNPDVYEVQQYVGGDISAYSDVNALLFGITSLIKEGNLEGLKTFIEQHYETLESSVDVIEYLKRIADNANSGELSKLIESLKTKVDTINKENSSIRAELKQTKQEKEALSDSVNTLKKENLISNRRISDLEEQLNSRNDSPVITTYKETNTSMIRCKVPNIIYFKEISYARYANSLISNLVEMLTTVQRKNVKLLIYDNRVGIPTVYKGISILSSADYLPNKNRIIRDTPKYVVSEPNSAFIEDVLQSTNPQFDVVIVYDRLRQATNIVAGNNVTKIFVINSYGEFENVKIPLKITSNNLIISSDKRIKESIVIPEILDYATSTTSAKLSRYIKSKSDGAGGEPILQTILNRSRIN